MPRIRPLTKEEMSPEARAVLEQSDRGSGRLSDSAGIQARCPPILEASRALSAAPGRSNQLPALVRSLVCLRVAQLARCPF